MGNYTPRAGFSSEDVKLLAFRFMKIDGRSNWDDLDDFCQWAADNGYKKGLHLRKENKDEPHSPWNSYFEDSHKILEEKHQKIQERIAEKSEFCIQCGKECPSDANGCFLWRENFISTWNKTICRKKPDNVQVIEKTGTKQYFRYEHPDLVREGRIRRR